MVDEHLLLRALAGRTTNGDPHEKIFVLGGLHERRIHMAAQQLRARDLAWSLGKAKARDGAPNLEGTTIGVVGGGIAGLTFTATAAALGATVAVYDEHDEPMSVQRASLQRYLHPRLFDWPKDEWYNEIAPTDPLRWKADVAAGVRNQVVAGFCALPAVTEAVIYLPQHVVHEVDISPEDHKLRVRSIDLRQFACGTRPEFCKVRSLDFDCVVIASGFLPEERRPGFYSGSYWRDDALHTLIAKPDGAVPVIGDGDGALSEVLRLTMDGGTSLLHFHQRLLPSLLGLEASGDEAQWLANAKYDLEAVDRDASDRLRSGTLSKLCDIQGVEDCDRVLEHAAQRHRVILFTRKPSLGTNSFLANRFLIARLTKVAGSPVTIAEHEVDVDPAQIERSQRPAVYRTGPPKRKRTQLVEPALDFRAAVETLDKDARHSGVAGVVLRLLDVTRDADLSEAWEAPTPDFAGRDLHESFDRLVAKRGTQNWHEDGEAGLRRESVPKGSTERSEAEHLETIVRSAAWLVATFAPALGDPWWATTRNGSVLLSVDFISIASDLRPRDVTARIANSSASGITRLTEWTERDGALGVEVDVNDWCTTWLSTEPGEDFAGRVRALSDTAAIASAPATWRWSGVDSADDAGVPAPPLPPADETTMTARERDWTTPDADALIGAFQRLIDGEVPASVVSELGVALVAHWAGRALLGTYVLRWLVDRYVDGEATWESVALVSAIVLGSDEPELVSQGLALLSDAVDRGESEELSAWIRRTLLSGGEDVPNLALELAAASVYSWRWRGDGPQGSPADETQPDSNATLGRWRAAAEYLAEDRLEEAVTAVQNPRIVLERITGLQRDRGEWTRAKVRQVRERNRIDRSPDADAPAPDWDKVLSSGDAQRTKGHPTGCIELYNAPPGTESATWFREVLFAGGDWTEDAPRGRPRYTRIVEFEVTYQGEALGPYELQVVHMPHLELNKSLRTTMIRWGELRSLTREHNLTGRTLSIRKLPDARYEMAMS